MDVVSGNIAMTFVSMGGHMALVRTGDLRVLAVAMAKRAPYLPDVPTFIEQGFPDFEATTWFALFAPRGTPGELVEQLNAFARGLAVDPASKERLESNFVDAPSMTAAQFGDMETTDALRWERIVRESGVKPD